MTLPFSQLQSAKCLPNFTIGRRAVDRNQAAGGMRAELFRKGDLFFCRKLRGCEIRRTEPLDQLRGKEFNQGMPIGRRRSGRSAPASTSPMIARRESRCGRPNGLCRSAQPGSRSQKRNAPDTAQSPGSAATSNTNVSDGSRAMVRKSFIAAVLRVSDRARRARPRP